MCQKIENTNETLEKTKNGQSRDTDNIGHTRQIKHKNTTQHRKLKQ